MTTRIVFMGSPEFAIPVLRRLADSYPVIGVVTQPDRPAGRGRILTPPPVKQFAEELHIPTIQPPKLRELEAMQQLIAWAPDLIIVAAFGQILRPEVLQLPRFGCVNVHASLLPRWRGAAPVQAAILNGDHQTGITIMCMDRGVDTGPLLSQQVIQISPEDTADTLAKKLSPIGADLLMDTLPDYLSGKLQPHPQDDSLATYAPMIKKEEGQLDFNQPAAHIERKVRAYNPWPGAYIFFKDKILKVHRSHVASTSSPQPGERVIYQGFPAIGTTDGILVLDEVQPAGKYVISGKAYLQGARDWMEESKSI